MLRLGVSRRGQLDEMASQREPRGVVVEEGLLSSGKLGVSGPVLAALA